MNHGIFNNLSVDDQEVFVTKFENEEVQVKYWINGSLEIFFSDIFQQTRPFWLSRSARPLARGKEGELEKQVTRTTSDK